MTTVVTGATGFLGSALVTELVKRQQSVRILVRDEKKARQQFGDAVTIIPGDITDAVQVQQAVDGATTIYHLAGRLYHPSIPAELYRQTHVEGTRTLLKACQGQTQLRRIVHVSTTGVHGVTGETPAAEDAPFAPTNPYEATKLEGELLALQACQKQGLSVSVVRPGLVYGPGDLHLLGFFVAIKKGRFRVIDGGKAQLHPVYIDDLVAALLLCAERPQALGRSYNIAGERPVTVRELATAIAHALDRELPAGSIPLWLANLAAACFYAYHNIQLTGRERDMLEVLPKVAKLQASYALGKPLALPMNLTISVSYRCNSRCKTCNVWQRPNDDFTIEEYDKTFESIGRDAYWFTFSGGEPTLRKDLPEMVEAAYRHCRPGIINIPTNGIQDRIIPGRIERVLQATPTSDVIVNLSLDGVGEKQDIVRGVKGNFERAMRTYAGLKALKGRYKNFTLGVHTVISNFNVDEFETIYAFVRDELKPDSFISEIAEERVELDTVGMGITPLSRSTSP